MDKRRRSRKRQKRNGYGRLAWLTSILLFLVLTGTGIYIIAGRLKENEPPRQPAAESTDREERLHVTEGKPQAAGAQSPAAAARFTGTVAQSQDAGAQAQDPGAQSPYAAAHSQDAAAQPSETDMLEEELNRIMASMTTEEKVAQLFIVTPEALTGVSEVTQAGEATRQALKMHPVGGLIYFRNNLQSPEQVKTLLGNTRQYGLEAARLPLILSVDEEGGRITRIGGREGFDVAEFPYMSQIGAQGDPQLAYEAGTAIGAYLSGYGFTLDFAPDADVLTNKDNQVIGSRSFGADPGLVWSMASQVAKGLREQGIQPVYKHFPGHGATLGDTHEGFAYTDKTLDQLMEAELVPFIRAAESGEDCIMAAHIAAPGVTGDEKPASLSHTLITEVLREKLGYDGVVVTDALNMGAIQNLYSSGEAAVMAVDAGVDLLLMPADFDAAYDALLQAVKDGRISQERLDASVQRIGRMKLRQTGGSHE